MDQTPSLFAFVLMPFASSFDDVYKLGIKETADSIGMLAQRVDEQIYQEGILERIYRQIVGQQRPAWGAKCRTTRRLKGSSGNRPLICAQAGGRCGQNKTSNKLKAKSVADSAMHALKNFIVKSRSAVAQSGVSGQLR